MKTSNDGVWNAVIKPMKEMFSPPRGCEDINTALRQYVDHLRDFTVDELEHGWRKLVGEYEYRTWPTVAEIKKSCKSVRKFTARGEAPVIEAEIWNGGDWRRQKYRLIGGKWWPIHANGDWLPVNGEFLPQPAASEKVTTLSEVMRGPVGRRAIAEGWAADLEMIVQETGVLPSEKKQGRLKAAAEKIKNMTAGDLTGHADLTGLHAAIQARETQAQRKWS